ncbi:MAG TPA: thymidylate synthase [Erysipelothrix sp.]
MRQYLDLCKYILENGEERDDRTGTGTISSFGHQLRFDLSEGFPLLTSKRVYYPAVFKELLWFISGDTNIRYLVDNNVRIWNEWPYENYKKSTAYQGESMIEFIEKIKEDDAFAQAYGDLGPVYGKQWRDFNGVDQLAQAIEQIKHQPHSRRIIISSWNPSEIEAMALPPCHTLMQFYVGTDQKLSLQLYQRSADLFLGVPFNIASYALLLHLVADVCDLEVGTFVHTFGDVHIYKNHIEQVKLQLSRDLKTLPQLKLKNHYDDITHYRYEDIEVINYDPHPTIKAKVSV